MSFVYKCAECGLQAQKPAANKDGLGHWRCPKHGPVRVKRETVKE